MLPARYIVCCIDFNGIIIDPKDIAWSGEMSSTEQLMVTMACAVYWGRIKCFIVKWMSAFAPKVFVRFTAHGHPGIVWKFHSVFDLKLCFCWTKCTLAFKFRWSFLPTFLLRYEGAQLIDNNYLGEYVRQRLNETMNKPFIHLKPYFILCNPSDVKWFTLNTSIHQFITIDRRKTINNRTNL